jgi:L-seryl-tRNA(Ser) seleniumtransferase
MGALRDAGVECSLTDSSATVGAGAFPTATLPSVALALSGDAERWAAALRAGEPAVVGRVSDGRLMLDLRTVPDDAAEALVTAVVAARG